jgi:hypothetical protein
MSTRSGVYKNATHYANLEGGGYVLVQHSIPQLAAKLSTWAAHMESKSEPDYSLGFTVSKDIHFDKHGDITVPAHVQPLISNSNEHESKAHTPTGSTPRAEEEEARRDEEEEKRSKRSAPSPGGAAVI